eukprot:gene8354-1491_t
MEWMQLQDTAAASAEGIQPTVPLARNCSPPSLRIYLDEAPASADCPASPWGDMPDWL